MPSVLKVVWIHAPPLGLAGGEMHQIYRSTLRLGSPPVSGLPWLQWAAACCPGGRAPLTNSSRDWVLLFPYPALLFTPWLRSPAPYY